MKTTTVRELRSNLASVLDGEESVLVTRHGRPTAVVLPLKDPSKIPPEIRRSLFLAITREVARQLHAENVTEAEIEREFEAHRKRRRR